MREFLEIHPRGRAFDAVEREGLDHLRPRHLLAIIAGRPAQKGEIVEQGVGLEPPGAEIADIGVAVALAVRLALVVDNHRQVRVLRRRRAKRVEEQDMPIGVFDVIVAADDMRDALGNVVAHVGQVKHGQPVAAHDDQILESVERLGQFPLDQVPEHDFAAHEREPDDVRQRRCFPPRLHAIEVIRQPEHAGAGGIEQAQIPDAGQATRGRNRTAVPAHLRIPDAGVIQPHRFIRMNLDRDRPDRANHPLRVFIRHAEVQRGFLVGPAAPRVSPTGGFEPARGFQVHRRPRRLVHHRFVVRETQPVQSVEQRGFRVLRRSLTVGVFHPKQKHAALVARKKPVENRRPYVADVDVPRRAGGKPHAYAHVSYSGCRTEAGQAG